MCGIHKGVSPIDVDHIVPQSKAKKEKVQLDDGRWIGVHDLENLQALCSSCIFWVSGPQRELTCF